MQETPLQEEMGEAREPQMWERSEKARFEATLATAVKEAQAYRKSQQTTKVARGAFVALFCVMTLCGMYELFIKHTGDATNFLTYICLMSGFGGAAMSQKHKEATEKLAEFDDVRAVGFLTDALESNDAAPCSGGAERFDSTPAAPAILRRRPALSGTAGSSKSRPAPRDDAG